MPAVKSHKTKTDEGSWDGPGNEKKLRSGESQAYYAKMYAWRDPDGDETTKSAYKFPHHVVSADGEPGAANVKGCQSGIGVLNGAMGGADIPEGDRQGVYRHLAAHLEDAGVEPAELASREDFEPLRGEGHEGFDSEPLRSKGREGFNFEPQRGEGHKENMSDEIERRSYAVEELRVMPAEMEGQSERIVGYAAVFNQLSEEIWGFREKIDPGAFAETIKVDDIRALWNHNPEYPLGRNRAGTLELMEDEHGLQVVIYPPETSYAKDLTESIRRRDVDQMSFGFIVEEDSWTEDGGRETGEEQIVTRTLKKVRLMDVSPVTFPAYPQTTVAVRNKISNFGLRNANLDGVSAGEAGQEPGEPETTGNEDPRARVRIARKRIEVEEKRI